MKPHRSTKLPEGFFTWLKDSESDRTSVLWLAEYVELSLKADYTGLLDWMDGALVAYREWKDAEHAREEEEQRAYEQHLADLNRDFYATRGV